MEKKIYFYVLPLALAAVMASCGADGNVPAGSPPVVVVKPADQPSSQSDEGPAQLCLTSVLSGVTTRADNVQNNAFDGEEALRKVDVYVEEDTEGDPSVTYGDNGLLVATAGTATDAALEFATAQYWPLTNNPLKIYAWYPSASIAGTGYSDEGLKFAVQLNQTEEVNYRKSDLIASPQSSYSMANRVAGFTQLGFSHLMTQLHFKLVPDANSSVPESELAGATVTLKNVVKSVTRNMTAGTTANTADRGDVALTMTVVPAAYLTDGDDDNDDYAVEGYCVIPPQNLIGRVINVALAGGGELNALLPDNAVHNLAEGKGKSYNYTITVSSSELAVQASIGAWATGSWEGTIPFNF